MGCEDWVWLVWGSWEGGVDSGWWEGDVGGCRVWGGGKVI